MLILVLKKCIGGMVALGVLEKCLRVVQYRPASSSDTTSYLSLDEVFEDLRNLADIKIMALACVGTLVS